MNIRARFISLLVCSAAIPAFANPLPNPGFEAGDAHWAVRDGASQIIADAAHGGKLGLRVGKAEYYPSGASVFSPRFPVAAGQSVTVTFWARATNSICGVYLWPYDANGKLVGKAPIGAVQNSGGEWKAYSKTATMPEGATAVALWIHTYGGATGIVDLDDFALSGLAPDAVAIPQPPQRPQSAAKTAANVAPDAIPPRKTPPVIILKFDDVKQMNNGDVHGRWKRLADYLEAKRIKGGFGVLCETLGDATPSYAQWFADRRKAGFVEFWFHGFDHKTHEIDGERYNEFNKRPYEEQKARVARSQALAREKLGFAFTAFGPPGGVGSASLDDNTLRVMAEDPDIGAVMYPMPFDAIGREYDASGKLTILDRVWAVNTESAVGVPDFQRFLNGYAQNLDREYFVLQGHPASWDDARFAQFEKIVDFLVAQKAVFMTPTEYAAVRRARAATSVAPEAAR